MNNIHFEKDFKDFNKILENKHFLKLLVKSYSELYSIEDSLKLLNPEDVVTEPDNTTKVIDMILERIELKEEFAEYIVEIELIKELLLKNSKFISNTSPIIHVFSRHFISYIFKVLSYGNIKSLYEYYELLQDLDEEGKPPMVVTILSKIIFTLQLVWVKSFNIAFITNTIPELNFHQPCYSIVNEKGLYLLSKQVFVEFNQYLLEKSFFEKQTPRECIIS
jgi:hypothetical protein